MKKTAVLAILGVAFVLLIVLNLKQDVGTASLDTLHRHTGIRADVAGSADRPRQNSSSVEPNVDKSDVRGVTVRVATAREQSAIRGATVSIVTKNSRSRSASCSTSALGVCNLQLVPGVYSFVAEAPSYALSFSDLIEIRSGREVVVMYMHPASYIEGRVLSRSVPVADAVVTAVSTIGNFEARTSSSGSFSVPVTPGVFELFAQKGDGVARRSNIVVGPASTSGGHELILSAGYNINGIALDIELKRGISDVDIEAHPGRGQQALMRSRSLGDGRFVVGPLPEGPYELSGASNGYCVGSTQTVVVNAGKSPLVQIELARAAAVRGRVVDLRGEMVVGAHVLGRRSCSGASDVELATTDSTGTFALTHMAAGDARIQAFRTGESLGAGKTVGLGSGQVAEVVLVLEASGIIRGRVSRRSGSPPVKPLGVMATSTQALSENPDEGTTDIDERGFFELAVPAGTYEIHPFSKMENVGGSFNSATVRVRDGETSYQDLEVEDDDEPLGTMVGTVLEPGGHPSALASVRIVSTNVPPTFKLAIQTDMFGQFKFVRPMADKNLPADVIAGNGGRVSDRLMVPFDSRQVSLQLHPAASVSGVYRSPSGLDEPITVTVAPVPGLGPVGRGTFSFPSSSFVLTEVPGLLVRLDVRGADGTQGSREIPASPGSVLATEIVGVTPAANPPQR